MISRIFIFILYLAIKHNPYHRFAGMESIFYYIYSLNSKRLWFFYICGKQAITYYIFLSSV